MGSRPATFGVPASRRSAAEVLASLAQDLFTCFDAADADALLIRCFSSGFARVALMARPTAQRDLFEILGTSAPALQVGVASALGRRIADVLAGAKYDAGVEADVLPDDLPPGLAAQLAPHLPASVHVLPLRVLGRTTGALVLLLAPGDPGPGQGFASELGHLLDVSRLHSEHARVSEVVAQRLRPPPDPTWPTLRAALRIRPASAHVGMSGDFVDLGGTEERAWFVLGDVCGKGVEAAVTSGRVRTAVRAAAHLAQDPACIHAVVNSELLEWGSAAFVTMVTGLAALDADTGHAEVTLANAGHPHPFVLRANGTITAVEGSDRLLGVLPDDARRTSVLVDLGPGDLLVCCSDGILEARSPVGVQFGYAGVVEAVQPCAGMPPAVLCDLLLEAAGNHVGDRIDDDISVLVLGPVRR